jgi:hypothetical protein
MAIHSELELRLPNSPGALAGVCRLLAEERVNILAMALDSHGRLRLVVDNRIRALGALRTGHHQVAERDVLVLAAPHVAGGLSPVLSLIAEAGVNLEYAYGAAPEGAAAGTVVLGVDDARRAGAAAGV